ncbi:hypothetical protein [Pyrolobus fumarii]|uniref:hypothetical protein n=1 Tax=Pyrolobus fumarii TaxID=54252 RepID=UPI00064F1593|nr:hypothetical protein [Pyrolobus fumarii]
MLALTPSNTFVAKLYCNGVLTAIGTAIYTHGVWHVDTYPPVSECQGVLVDTRKALTIVLSHGSIEEETENMLVYSITVPIARGSYVVLEAVLVKTSSKTTTVMAVLEFAAIIALIGAIYAWSIRHKIEVL